MRRSAWPTATVAAAAVVAAALCAACSSSDSGASSTAASQPSAPANSSGSGDATIAKTWAYGSVTDASPLFKGLGDTLVSEAQAQGIKMLRYDNKIDANAALANGRLALQQGAKFVIDWAAGSTNTALGQVLKQANVPCIAIQAPIPGCQYFNEDSAGVGSQLAQTAAPIAKARGWGAGNITVLLVPALAGGDLDHQSSTNFYSSFAAAFPGMKQEKAADISLSTTSIGNMDGVQVDGKGTLDGAFAAVQRALQSIPKSRHVVVYANNDDMAQGALRALQLAGRDHDALLTSQGADEAALKALREGTTWVGEGGVFFNFWPNYLLAMGIAMQHNLTPPAVTIAPTVILTKDNVSTYFGTGTTPLKAAPLPAVDKYLEPYLKVPGN